MPRLFDLLSDNTRKELAGKTPKVSGKKTGRCEKQGHESGPGRKKTETQSITTPDFVALDVETTGLDFKNDRIIEIGAVRFINGKAEQEFNTLVNAGVVIPEHIVRLTGIKTEDIRTAPAFSDVAMQLLEFIGNLPLCGHQIEFDANFIDRELKRASLPSVTMQFIDTALLSRILLQSTGRFSLKHVSDALSITLDSAHRALHDARASGEIASILIPRLAALPLNVRRTFAAFAPASLFKSLIFQSLGRAKPGITLSGGLPFQPCSKMDNPEWALEVESSDIEQTFSSEGKLSKVIKGFSPRKQQSDMAQYVTDTLNRAQILVAEAGTGTGKSLAYLVPAAFHAVKNNCRVIISTRTRNLQDQLLKQDLPSVGALFDEKLRFCSLKGRSNYLCRNRFTQLLSGEFGNLSPRERIAVLPLICWAEATVTGDIEEQNLFNPKWFSKIWSLISADSHECSGRRCPCFSTCFVQKARNQAQGSHIVVINHALFYSDICSQSSFLGEFGSIIFDEAHHLQSSGHRHLRTELDTNRVKFFFDKLQNFLQEISLFKNEENIFKYAREIKSHLKGLRKKSQDMLHELDNWAKEVYPDLESEYQIRYGENSLSKLPELCGFDTALCSLQDTLLCIRQSITGLNDHTQKVELLQSGLQCCSEHTSQLRADLQYLGDARTEEHVFWIEGNHEKNWTKLCGVPLDISSILSDIWSRFKGGVIFTSATLASCGSTDYFRKCTGLFPHEKRTTSVIFPSPYSGDQVLAGAIKSAPEPDNPEFVPFAADVITTVHTKFKKNILVLFTSKNMLNGVYNQLKSREVIGRNNLLAQGFSGTRHFMLDQFKESSNMILLGTESFWEGIDAPGESCEIVIIPRLPFPVPSHPLTHAIASRMESINGESFFSYSVPEAVIKYRQGAGRLIRSCADRGVLLVLDSRILSKGYGKQFTRALDAQFNDFSTVENMLDEMECFFENKHNIKFTYG